MATSSYFFVEANSFPACLASSGQIWHSIKRFDKKFHEHRPPKKKGRNARTFSLFHKSNTIYLQMASLASRRQFFPSHESPNASKTFLMKAVFVSEENATAFYNDVTASMVIRDIDMNGPCVIVMVTGFRSYANVCLMSRKSGRNLIELYGATWSESAYVWVQQSVSVNPLYIDSDEPLCLQPVSLCHGPRMQLAPKHGSKLQCN